MNLQKSKSITHSNFNIENFPIPIITEEETITHLGFRFNKDGLVMTDSAWENILKNLNPKAARISTLTISIFGKAHLVKSILFGKISYYAEILLISKKTNLEFKRIFNKALWQGRTKVALQQCQLPLKDGGLNIPNPITWQKCRHILWIKK